MPARILVVDDAPDVCELLRLLLEGEGYSVTLAANGHEALRRLAEHTPALILLDLHMPGMDGWQLHAELRRRHVAVPVVYMTEGQAAAEARRHGADGYVAKPFELDALLAAVRRWAA